MCIRDRVPQYIGPSGPWEYADDVFPRQGRLYEGRDIFFDLDQLENIPIAQKLYENMKVLGDSACSVFTTLSRESSIWHLYLVPFQQIGDEEKVKNQTETLLRQEKSNPKAAEHWESGEKKIVQRLFIVALVCANTRAQGVESPLPKKLNARGTLIHTDLINEENDEEVMIRHSDYLETVSYTHLTLPTIYSV
eukprot:TRINITY_DN3279_c0_g2_i2.p1 TRINITY_DN3279_c0_g2~~TRINITY_DN3279_c0_g2_i2.p1  ORF type:complete len:193 (+),score=39.61 TRINITY_DN3279_c0_g2_i2:64-642(+)